MPQILQREGAVEAGGKETGTEGYWLVKCHGVQQHYYLQGHRKQQTGLCDGGKLPRQC